jgi:hypothetical protein
MSISRIQHDSGSHTVRGQNVFSRGALPFLEYPEPEYLPRQARDKHAEDNVEQCETGFCRCTSYRSATRTALLAHC